MRSSIAIFLGMAAAFLFLPNAEADVKVSFVDPQDCQDFSSDTASMRDAALNELRRTFEALTARTLKPGQNLEIEVLDVQRAGMSEQLSPTVDQLRILRGSTPPRIKIAYTLTQKGRVLLHGEETISGMNYLVNPTAHLSSDPLIYEKVMLRDLFRQRFGAMNSPPR